jgi:hypothetical protein
MRSASVAMVALRHSALISVETFFETAHSRWSHSHCSRYFGHGAIWALLCPPDDRELRSHVYISDLPGSEEPNPPRTGRTRASGGAGLTDATSNESESDAVCGAAPAGTQTSRPVTIASRLRVMPDDACRVHKSVKSARMSACATDSGGLLKPSLKPISARPVSRTHLLCVWRLHTRGR